MGLLRIQSTLELENGRFIVKYDPKNFNISEVYDWNGEEAPEWVWEMAEKTLNEKLMADMPRRMRRVFCPC